MDLDSGHSKLQAAAALGVQHLHKLVHEDGMIDHDRQLDVTGMTGALSSQAACCAIVVCSGSERLIVKTTRYRMAEFRADRFGMLDAPHGESSDILATEETKFHPTDTRGERRRDVHLALSAELETLRESQPQLLCRASGRTARAEMHGMAGTDSRELAASRKRKVSDFLRRRSAHQRASAKCPNDLQRPRRQNPQPARIDIKALNV